MAFGDYQNEIYFQGLAGVVPALPMVFAEWEARAERALSPSLWSYVAGYPAPRGDTVAEGLREFVRRWAPILDVCQECGIRYAFEVHPGQVAFDLYSAEMVLDALNGREEFGFTFDPVHSVAMPIGCGASAQFGW